MSRSSWTSTSVAKFLDFDADQGEGGAFAGERGGVGGGGGLAFAVVAFFLGGIVACFAAGMKAVLSTSVSVEFIAWLDLFAFVTSLLGGDGGLLSGSGGGFALEAGAFVLGGIAACFATGCKAVLSTAVTGELFPRLDFPTLAALLLPRLILR